MRVYLRASVMESPTGRFGGAAMLLWILCLVCESATSDSAHETLTAAELKVFGQAPRTHDGGTFVADLRPRFEWGWRCDSNVSRYDQNGTACRRQQVRMLRLELYDCDEQSLILRWSWELSNSQATSGEAPRSYRSKEAIPLKSVRDYIWKVTTWSSRPGDALIKKVANATFRTALLSEHEWKKSIWIGGGTQLRGELSIGEDDIQSASVFAAGVGCFRLWVNGQPVESADFYDTGLNAFDRLKHVHYHAYDVATMLSPNSTNVVGARLGRCWLRAPYCSNWMKEDASCLGFRMQMHIRYKNGSEQVVGTVLHHNGMDDDNEQPHSSIIVWRATSRHNPLVMSSLWDGEEFDARIGTDDWCHADCANCHRWQHADTYSGPALGALELQTFEATGIGEVFTPVHIEKRKSSYVFDFGKNIAGVSKLNVVGPRGTDIRLHYGEILDDDGHVPSVFQDAGADGAKQRDLYTLRGDEGGETYTPLFTYHGFRYVEVYGFPEAPTELNLTAHFIHALVPRIAEIGFPGHQKLNKLQDMVLYTMLSNIQSIPTDCPHREKMGWLADAHLASETNVLNFDMRSLYRNFMKVIQDTQELGCHAWHEDLSNDDEDWNVPRCMDKKGRSFEGRIPNLSGSLPDVVPYTGVGYWPGDVAWMVAAVIMPWVLARRGNDMTTAEEYIGSARGVMKFLRRHVRHGLVDMQASWGDHASRDGRKIKKQVTAFSALLALSKLIDLERSLDSGRQRLEAIQEMVNSFTRGRSAYMRRYVQESRLWQRSQGAAILALHLSSLTISTPRHTPNVSASAGSQQFGSELTCVAQTLIKDLEKKHLPQNGIISMQFLLDLLLQFDRGDLALKVVDAFWGRMADEGPGTIWETIGLPRNWGQKSMNSPAFGAALGPFLHRLAGLEIETTSPGENIAARFVISHMTSAYVGAAWARRFTSWGWAALNWTMDSDACRLEANVTAPPGSLVELRMPWLRASSKLYLLSFRESEIELPVSAGRGSAKSWRWDLGVPEEPWIEDGFVVLQLDSGMFPVRVDSPECEKKEDTKATAKTLSNRADVCEQVDLQSIPETLSDGTKFGDLSIPIVLVLHALVGVFVLACVVSLARRRCNCMRWEEVGEVEHVELLYFPSSSNPSASFRDACGAPLATATDA